MVVSSEELIVYGRRFRVAIEGPDAARRYSAVITEIATGRLLTRSPVRGRSPGDARERALEVMHTLLGIERLQEQIVAVAARLAPGAAVALSEDAQAIFADLSGPWRLGAPLAVPRDEVTDPDADTQALRARIEAHFRRHLQRADG